MKYNHIVKTKDIKDSLGLIISDFAISVGITVTKEKFNKAHDKCLKRIYKFLKIKGR